MQKQVEQSFDEYFPENQNISNERTKSPLRWERTQSQRTQSPLRWESTQSQRTQSPLRWEQRAQSPLRNHDPPKTTSFNEKESGAAALSGADQFLFQNIRSYSRRICEEEMSKIGRDSSPIRSRSIGTPARSTSLQSRSTGTPPRSSSSSSRVFIREDDAPPTPTSDDSTAEEDDSITVLTYSKSPYEDFRQSMQEMVEARVVSNGVVDRQFMEELLFRYLDLNNEKYYGCIVRAFLDLIVISREDSGRFPARRRPWIGGRRKLKLEIKRMRKFCESSPFVPKFVPK